MTARILQIWLLRLAGITEMFAFGAVVMPRSWMEAAHEWLGMGAMPSGAVVDFLTRQASYVYAMHGVSLLLLATDVRRYRPLIVFNGVSFVIAGPVFFAIDFLAGMPWYWTAGDTLGVLGFGVALLVLDAVGRRDDGDADSQP
jgi:hypothetical protein